MDPNNILDPIHRARSNTSSSIPNNSHRKAIPAAFYPPFKPASSPDEVPRSMNRPPLPRQSSHSSSRNSSNPQHVQDKFAELRDAAFYSSDLPGFLLSADEKLCYPHVYVGRAPEEPVELENLEEYFIPTWNCWTEDFSRPLILEEYPAIWLSRNREPFRGWRIGIPQGDVKMVFECRGQPLFSPSNGEFIGGITYVQELGELEELRHKRHQEELRSFEAICDSLPHIVWTAEGSGGIDYFSKAWYEFTGMTEAESMIQGWRSAIHPDDRAEAWQQSATILDLKGSLELQYRIKRRDGEYRWQHAKCKPKLDSAGNVIRWSVK